MARELLVDLSKQGPRALIVLFSSGGRQVSRKLVEMIKDGSANLFVGGVSRPEVRWCSAGHAGDAPERRRTKLLVFCHQKTCPVPQVLKKPLELPVQLIVLWDFPESLLDVLHHVDDLTQDSVESGDGIVRWWRVGRRTGPLQEQARGSGDCSLGTLILQGQ
jgi:hypothetical protein